MLNFIFSFILCFHARAEVPTLEKPVIVASFSTLASIINTLVPKGSIELVTLIPLGEDPHHFQVSAKELKSLRKSQLIFVNGLSYEPWLSKLFTTQETKAKVVITSNQVNPLKDSRGQSDPHSFNSPHTLKKYFQVISSSLAQVLPEHKKFISENNLKAQSELEKISLKFTKEFSMIPEHQRVIFTTHASAGYISDFFKIQVISLLGVNSLEGFSSKDLRKIKTLLKEKPQLTLFADSEGARLIAKKFKDELNFSEVSELSLEGLPSAGDYTAITLIEHNLNQILKALKK